MDGVYYNLWSTDNERTDANDDKVIKSVYDPSPVGYSLPASNAFTGFTTTVVHWTNNPSEWNVEGSFDKGLYFYTQANKAGKTTFFSASGYRHFSVGTLGLLSMGAHCWVSGLSGTYEGRYLDFASSHISPMASNRRSYGFCVRSAEERGELRVERTLCYQVMDWEM